MLSALHRISNVILFTTRGLLLLESWKLSNRFRIFQKMDEWCQRSMIQIIGNASYEYRIVYRLEDERILIVAVIHGHQDFEPQIPHIKSVS